MRTTPRVAVIAASLGFLITCHHDGPTRAECATHPRCRIVTDTDGDLDLADDLRRARNELLYPPGQDPPTSGTIYLYPPELPPAGVTYQWKGEVAFCGSTEQPTGDAEPDCEAVRQIPRVYFKGWWHSLPFDADCQDFAPDEGPEIGAIYSCLHIGDRFVDGDAEPRVVVHTDQRLAFRHQHAFQTTFPAISTAVWLDGVRNSTFAVEVRSDVPRAPDDPETWPEDEGISLAGFGAYVSAIDSTIEVQLGPGDGVPPKYGLVVDGPMHGTGLNVVSDFGAVAAQPHSVFVVSPGDPLGLYPFNDGCAYGPDDPVGSCTDFWARVEHTEQPDPAGQDAVLINDGDRIGIELDLVFRDLDHGAVKLDSTDGILGSVPGDVGRVDISGVLDFGGNGGAAALVVNQSAVACIDAQITTQVGECIHTFSNGRAIVAPTCSCNGGPCEGEPWGPPCTE